MATFCDIPWSVAQVNMVMPQEPVRSAPVTVMLVPPGSRPKEDKTGAVAFGFTVAFVKPEQEVPTQPCRRNATHAAILGLLYVRLTLVEFGYRMFVLKAQGPPVLSCTCMCALSDSAVGPPH